MNFDWCQYVIIWQQSICSIIINSFWFSSCFRVQHPRPEPFGVWPSLPPKDISQLIGNCYKTGSKRTKSLCSRGQGAEAKSKKPNIHGLPGGARLVIAWPDQCQAQKSLESQIRSLAPTARPLVQDVGWVEYKGSPLSLTINLELFVVVVVVMGGSGDFGG